VVASPIAERRIQKRSKLKVPVRVRPSDPEHEDQFDQILKTQNTCRNGIYLAGDCKSYREGMRLFITYPYTPNASFTQSEYWGEVIRLDHLENGSHGVAIKLLGSMNLKAS
jgi:hypothetical protein